MQKLIMALVLGAALLSPAAAKDVYVILSSDTSVWWNTAGQKVESCCYSSELDFSIFSDAEWILGDVFSEDFRTSVVDSDGSPFKISWFMHGGGWFTTGTNSTPISATFQIKHYWEEELEHWGDEIAYHFHHFKWNGSNWPMAPTFAETIPEFEWVMSQMTLDEGDFPVSFRAGWNYMDNPYQQYLERWMPSRFSSVNWRRKVGCFTDALFLQ